MKALGLVVSDKIFESCILKTYFLTPWPTYVTNRNHLNNFGRGHLGIIPVEFGQIPFSGSREEFVWSFPYKIKCNIVTPQGGVSSNPRGIIWTKLVEDL